MNNISDKIILNQNPKVNNLPKNLNNDLEKNDLYKRFQTIKLKLQEAYEEENIKNKVDENLFYNNIFQQKTFLSEEEHIYINLICRYIDDNTIKNFKKIQEMNNLSEEEKEILDIFIKQIDFYSNNILSLFKGNIEYTYDFKTSVDFNILNSKIKNTVSIKFESITEKNSKEEIFKIILPNIKNIFMEENFTKHMEQNTNLKKFTLENIHTNNNCLIYYLMQGKVIHLFKKKEDVCLTKNEKEDYISQLLYEYTLLIIINLFILIIHL